MTIEPLVDLATVINQEHALTYYATLDALEHAILCGEALIEAQKEVPTGQWTKWCEANLEIKSGTISNYIRIATYRQHLLAADDRPRTINAAVNYLQAIEAPRLVTPTGRSRFDVEEAKRLREMGMSYDAIGEMLGVSGAAVNFRLEPEATREHVRRKKQKVDAKRAAEREEYQKMLDIGVASHGGVLAVAYSQLRRCEYVIQKEMATTDNATGWELRKALVAIHRAEDVVLHILGIKRERRHIGKEP